MNAIYLWTNNITGKQYIGQTSNLKRRLKYYEKENFKTQRALYAAFKKHGAKNFTFKILWSSTIDDFDALNIFERDFIYLFDTMAPNGYNLKEGGSNGKFSEETKKKMSKSGKGRILSAEHKQRISDSMKGKPGLGKASKPVIQLTINGEFIKEWTSATEADRELGFNKMLISRCCYDESKTHKGFKWKFKSS